MAQFGKYIKTAGMYSALIVGSLLVLTIIMQLWRADIHIPFHYEGDSLQTGEWIKSIIDNGWYLENKYTGMPTGRYFHDFPMSENIHYAIIKVITFFTDSYAVAINIFYILTFPLIVCTSFYVFRRFSISPFLSAIGAFLFSFLEYHYARNIPHLFLGAYYLVPLIIMVMLWLFSGELETIESEGSSQAKGSSINPKFRGSIIICLLLSASNVYYAYFSCFLLLVTGAVRSVWQKKFRPVVTAVILITTITVGGLINIAPNILFYIQNGMNPAATARVYHEAELYSLKITDMLLPVTGHRIKFLADMKDKHEREISFLYTHYEPKPAAGLGMIGSAGFIFLLIFLIVYRRNGTHGAGGSDQQHILLYLSILNIAALLMATVGGFDSLVSHIIRYKIRAYERLSLFIAFFSLFAVLILVQQFYDTYVKNRKKPSIRFLTHTVYLQRVSFYIFMSALLLFGLFDQAGISSTPDYDSVKKKFLHDKKFVARIEQAVPRNTMIFQLPYVAYPESVHPHKMTDYDHLRFYLNSTKLRWSFGAIKGRSGDLWQKETASKPTPDMIRKITARGFRGILIDKNGYEDNGEKIIREVKNIIHTEPIMSDDNSIVFFSIQF